MLAGATDRRQRRTHAPACRDPAGGAEPDAESTTMTRRGNGEGTIYKRKDGRYEGAVTLEGRKRKRVYGNTRREVQSQLAELLRAKQRGELIAEPSQKVGDYLARWLEDQARLNVRPRTYESYALNVRRLIPHIGRIRLDKLRPAQLEHCYAELLDSGLSARTVEQAHAVLRIALRRAVRIGLLSQTPTASVTPPRGQRREMQILAPEQVQALLHAAEGHHLQPLWLLLVTTGLRLGEATGLTWANVNLETGTVTVRQALQRQRGKGLRFVEPKTSRSRRTVHLAPRVVAALKQHRTRQMETYLRNGAPWSGDALVFSTRTARPLEPRNVHHSFRRALSRADLPVVRVHDLRHTAASYLLSIGTHPKIVQELLGHSSITLTLDTYSHVLPALHREVAAQMDRLIGEPGKDGDGGESEPPGAQRARV